MFEGKRKVKKTERTSAAADLHNKQLSYISGIISSGDSRSGSSIFTAGRQRGDLSEMPETGAELQLCLKIEKSERFQEVAPGSGGLFLLLTTLLFRPPFTFQRNRSRVVFFHLKPSHSLILKNSPSQFSVILITFDQI